MKNRTVKIISASPSFWYYDLIGKTVAILSEDHDGTMDYRVDADLIINKSDAILYRNQ
jgi:hypothetical protein